ncbi:uncharacterized protein LOC143359450 isoform X2 [Halictus rubicundus]|uniref:uncharacterized protein LOC143359450 isoform X2 n=1 Tax=Halictus rubicundus TaxID=77578 RepID=UPI004036B89B
MKPNSSSQNDATEKMLRRREWKLEQERQRQHERLKQKKIYEYEMQRAREKGLLPPKPPNRSKSRSKSPRSRPRRPCTPSTTNTPILSERRLEFADETVPLFKGPEGTKISAAELRRIKVDIRRNIPGKSTDSDLQWHIINPEDVLIKRRAGEGSKPIFERKEIKGVITETEEVEEHRTVVTINNDTLDGKSKTFKNRSVSLSPIRNRSRNPRRSLSRRSRERYRSRNRSKEYEDSSIGKERRRTESYIAEEERHRRSRDHSRSREREERKWDRDSHHRCVMEYFLCDAFRSYREYRERSRERSRNNWGGNRSRVQRVLPPHYVGQIPVPIYYNHFPPRPIMMGPLMPMRGQVLLGNRHPSMMGPPWPFSPSLRPSNHIKYRSKNF